MRTALVALIVMVGSTAHATEFTNKNYLNKNYLNKNYLNKNYLNAAQLGVVHANGGTVNGFSLAKMKHANGQTIDDVAVVRDYLTGYTWIYESVRGGRPDWNYRFIQKHEFDGATLDATVTAPGQVTVIQTITLEITDVVARVRDGETFYQHVVQWQDDRSGEYSPVCGCENGDAPCTPVPATLVQGAWNYTEGTLYGGAKISNDPGLVTIACADAAIGKCAADHVVRGPSTPTSSTSHVMTSSFDAIGSYPVFPGTTVTVVTSGGYGNVDLYVAFDVAPTLTHQHCLADAPGEPCTLAVPAGAETVHVALGGYGAATVSVSSTSSARGMGYVAWGIYGCSAPGVCETASSRLQACTRMVTADYCGDGTSHTLSGRPIDVFDFYIADVNDPTPGLAPPDWFYEAEWTADGANWINNCRVDELDLSDADPGSCPSYGGYVHPIELQISSADDPLACIPNDAIVYDQPGRLYNKNDGTYYPRQTRW
jgi:hypothetical protein